MLRLTNEEMETHLNMVASDRSIWEIATDDPVMVARLEKVGATFVREDFSGTTRFYTLPANQVTIRRAVVMSDRQKAQLAERARTLNSRTKAAVSKGEDKASDE